MPKGGVECFRPLFDAGTDDPLEQFPKAEPAQQVLAEANDLRLVVDVAIPSVDECGVLALELGAG